MIIASVLMAKPGVHVQSEVAAAAEMIKLKAQQSANIRSIKTSRRPFDDATI
jgi:hypothetical protein